MTTITPTHQPSYTSLVPNQEQIAAQFGGDAAAELAALVFLFARERSRDASEQRQSIEHRIQADGARQVEQMRKSADDTRLSAVINGTAKILSGAAQIGSVATASAPSSSGAPAADTASAPSASGAPAANNHLSQYLSASAPGLEGAGVFGGGYFEGSAQHHDARAQAAENAADAGKRSLDEVNENADAARDMNSRVLDFLDQIQEGKADAAQSMWVRA